MTEVSKGRRIAYWVVTAFFLLPMAGSGIPELLWGGSADTVVVLTHLGYPLYLMRILGLAKILGAVPIVTGKAPRLKEWAYAGYTFDLLGAAASHLIVGDRGPLALPIVMLALVLTSYALWRRTPAATLGPPDAGERRAILGT